MLGWDPAEGNGSLGSLSNTEPSSPYSGHSTGIADGSPTTIEAGAVQVDGDGQFRWSVSSLGHLQGFFGVPSAEPQDSPALTRRPAAILGTRSRTKTIARFASAVLLRLLAVNLENSSRYLRSTEIVLVAASFKDEAQAAAGGLKKAAMSDVSKISPVMAAQTRNYQNTLAKRSTMQKEFSWFQPSFNPPTS
eukprot:3666528-Rhodomonas_salina.2